MPTKDVTITSHFFQLNKAGVITPSSAPMSCNESETDGMYSYWASSFSKGSSRKMESIAPYVVHSLAENVRMVHSSRHQDMYALGRWAGKKQKKPVQQFCTGSRYVGEWNALGFTGVGIYRYPHGVIYEGEFNKKGQFHGIGTLIYPSGQKVQAMWKNGRLLDGADYVFNTGEVQDEYHKYCQSPDRRYHIEISKDFGAVGHEYMTNEPTPKTLPDGCYDVAYGIYDPKTYCIYAPMNERTDSIQTKDLKIMDDDKYKGMLAILGYQSSSQEDVLAEKDMAHNLELEFSGMRIIEIPTKSRAKWIEQNCRKAWDEPCGYQKKLYEYWLAGRRWEIEDCEAQSSGYLYRDNSTDDKLKDDESDQEHRKRTLVSFVQRISEGKSSKKSHSTKEFSSKRKTLEGGIKLAEIDRT